MQLLHLIFLRVQQVKKIEPIASIVFNLVLLQVYLITSWAMSFQAETLSISLDCLSMSLWDLSLITLTSKWRLFDQFLFFLCYPASVWEVPSKFYAHFAGNLNRQKFWYIYFRKIKTLQSTQTFAVMVFGRLMMVIRPLALMGHFFNNFDWLLNIGCLFLSFFLCLIWSQKRR